LEVAVPLLPSLFHIGYVVRDADAAITELQHQYSLPVSRSTIEGRWKDALFRGQRCSFGADYHFLSFGNTELEVIEPEQGDSPYTEFLDATGGGVHHLAFVVGSIEEYLAAVPAATVLLDAEMPGGARFVYAEGMLQGVLVELIQRP
jgi:catechol 2,3-dioxygenase-like lactoylglutathione lyase family enzyme